MLEHTTCCDCLVGSGAHHHAMHAHMRGLMQVHGLAHHHVRIHDACICDPGVSMPIASTGVIKHAAGSRHGTGPQSSSQPQSPPTASQLEALQRGTARPCYRQGLIPANLTQQWNGTARQTHVAVSERSCRGASPHAAPPLAIVEAEHEQTTTHTVIGAITKMVAVASQIPFNTATSTASSTATSTATDATTPSTRCWAASTVTGPAERWCLAAARPASCGQAVP